MRYQDITSFDCFFFFNDTATTEIYTLSLHDALPISPRPRGELAEEVAGKAVRIRREGPREVDAGDLPMAGCAVLAGRRSEEHTSELQSRQYLVCRLLLEKKKTQVDI